ncbi:hypothetical protein [Paenibacillus odorifer]|uniref:Bacteriophage SP-beta YorD domain-containing protein n=1 Tax=Paenibacillus odorifer TaxID=189426 RepID=A0AAD0KMD5_9BACL|nr:hypothetical protein [Paenibacillus odorifer]AWV35149.1 hypothetical protein CD191_22325 [Paenibacillus odorifer]
MKLVPRTELEGQYIDDVSVDDSFTGVVPIYAQPEPEEAPELPEDEEIEVEPDVSEEPEQPREIIGYLVGIPLPTGLYHPRFDLAAWNAYQDVVLEAQSDYADELHDWREQWAEGEGQGPEPVYTPPVQPDNLWVEGLTPEEIAELTKPGEETEVEKLKLENEALKKLIEDKDRENKNALFEIYSILLGGE